MRLLSVLALLAASVPLFADDKPEDKAKEAAVALLKAIKSKDADAVLNLSDVPFVYRDGGLALHKETDTLKKWVSEKLEELKDADKIPTTVDELLPFATVKEKIKDATERTAAEEVIGKDGFVAFITDGGGKKVAIAVKLKDGKARIVGIVR
jgi:rRNA maturation endonuclease Nob1